MNVMKKGILTILLCVGIFQIGFCTMYKAKANGHVAHVTIVEKFNKSTKQWHWIDGTSIKKWDIFRIWMHGVLVYNPENGCEAIQAETDAIVTVKGTWYVGSVSCADELLQIYEGVNND